MVIKLSLYLTLIVFKHSPRDNRWLKFNQLFEKKSSYKKFKKVDFKYSYRFYKIYINSI